MPRCRQRTPLLSSTSPPQKTLFLLLLATSAVMSQDLIRRRRDNDEDWRWAGLKSEDRRREASPFEAAIRKLRVFQNNLLGCLYSDSQLCNDDEICFDDNLFGRCVSATDPDDRFIRFSDLSDVDRTLFTLELDKLADSGLGWDDVYSQCTLKNIEDAIQYNEPFDETDCDVFLNANDDEEEELDDDQLDEDANDLGDLEADLENDLENDLGEEEREEELMNQLAQTSGSVVPKKMLDKRDFYDQNPLSQEEEEQLGLYDPANDVLKIQEDEDGILVEPNSRELMEQYILNMDPESSRETLELPVEDDREIEDLVEEEQELPFVTMDQVDLPTYLAMKDALNEAILESEDATARDQESALGQDFIPEVFWPRDQQEELEDQQQQVYLPSEDEEIYWPQSEQQPDDEEETSDVRKVGKRSGDDGEIYIPQNLGLDRLLAANYPSEVSYTDYADYDPAAIDNYEDIMDNTANTVSRARGGGLGSHIFNRIERLDVKKPGPFYPNSANNFFLDKLLNSDYQNQYDDLDYSEGKGKNDTEKQDVGQVEYEMPLLAPSKEKRMQSLQQESPEETKPGDFVHIKLKRRLSTWNQGANFLSILADEFGIPEHAITDRLIEDHHVQFSVAPNPNSVDARQMAKRIESDSALQSRLSHSSGVEIDRAVSGSSDVDASFFPSGHNFNLLLLSVIAASALAAVVVATVMLLLVKRRRRISRKQELLSGAEKGDGEQAKEEYKQLCRDWSRSSKKLEKTPSNPPSNVAKKQVQNQDSRESNRSSTSSWPEEPTYGNMDVGTGHAVLSYMECHIKNKQRLEQEWVSLCGYEAEPSATTIAFKAENKKKNRYPDKLPYDHNRIILNAMVNGNNADYINASSVTDHDPRNPSYILTQAPLASTVADFWQMVWEQGCVCIVMLTQLSDNGHQLCHRYWPEEGSEQFHIFQVHLVSEHVWCEDYLVRSVYLKNIRTGETRTVTQFHFKSWPAHGIPSIKSILEFRRKVNKSYRGRSCPIVVHCSDGVGRSGCYTLIDMVMYRMTKGAKEIDITATLEHIRDQRGGTVQTRQQFEFCLNAIAQEVNAILNSMPKKEGSSSSGNNSKAAAAIANNSEDNN